MENISPWFVLALGMATVFIGLAAIIVLTKLMSALLVKKSAPASPAVQAAPAPVGTPQPQPQPAACPIPDRACFDAVIAAAIATYTGTEAPGLRIHSIKPVSAPVAGDGEHGRFVAAVAAAIATASGTEASGLRIHSIKRV